MKKYFILLSSYMFLMGIGKNVCAAAEFLPTHKMAPEAWAQELEMQLPPSLYSIVFKLAENELTFAEAPKPPVYRELIPIIHKGTSHIITIEPTDTWSSFQEKIEQATNISAKRQILYAHRETINNFTHLCQFNTKTVIIFERPLT